MSQIIKIKRSAATTAPTSLSEGELAYSFLSKNLFIGTNAANIAIIGGEEMWSNSHEELHNIASHTDTTATGAQLNTLTGGASSDADALHTHDLLIPLTQKGQASGVVPLNSSVKIDESYLPSSVLGGLNYKGLWNANTNTPDLTALTPVNGDFYIVDTAGSTNLDGITNWNIGDWAIHGGSAWHKVDNTDHISSVNGKTGIVVLTTTDIAEGTHLYYTNVRADARVQTAIQDSSTSTTTLWSSTKISSEISAATTGGVFGPAAAVAGHIATFDGITGKLIKDSSYTIATSVPSGALFTDTQNQIDATATDGETGHSISSDWAYDHEHLVGNGGHVPSIGSAGQFLAHNGAWAVPAKTQVHDTPVDGATTIAVSSNWAYDHALVDTDLCAPLTGGAKILSTTCDIDGGTF